MLLAHEDNYNFGNLHLTPVIERDANDTITVDDLPQPRNFFDQELTNKLNAIRFEINSLSEQVLIIEEIVA